MTKDRALQNAYRAILSYQTFGVIQNVDALKREIAIALNQDEPEYFSEDVLKDGAIETVKILEHIKNKLR